ncbi:MAG: fused MFS/spermidine synthase, partial [Acidobacteriota bacterium]|nr:fused MFS/spermidine synthase [Acidobacteriota bacterium]
PDHLTTFYLMVSVGGALGGLFIGVAAPSFFNALYDLPVVISITALLLAYLFWREYKGDGIAETAASGVMYQPALVIACVGGALGYGIFGAQGGAAGFAIGGVFALAVSFIRRSLSRAGSSETARLFALAVAAGLAVGVTGFLVKDAWRSFSHARVLARNFYGALVVYDKSTDGSMGPVRVLQHGTIDHGEQFLWPQNQRFPTTYYARKSGIGLTIQTLQVQGPMTVGVIGLGAGTLTAYARPVDHYHVYDINPLVLQIAQTQFTFLRDCLGPHEVVLGDARLSLEREPIQKFDVLAVDAFSGDAIPVHLLTREAYRLYWRHLKPDGVLAVHVSNRYLTLGPVVALGAAELGKTAKMLSFETDDRDSTEESDSDWVLVTSRPGFFGQPELKSAHDIKPIGGLHMWTDDYSNLYRILR